MRLAMGMVVVAMIAAAQEDHAHHAHDVAGLGTVDLRTSCNAEAQPLIARAAAMLHSFGYEESRLTFLAAAKADPGCGMALWGAARTWYHPIWAPPTIEELKQGSAALEHARSV